MVYKNDRDFAQFIFPKEALLNQNILKSDTTKGKMGIRVYPSWDHPNNEQANETKAWQEKYFVEINESDNLPVEKTKSLYDV